MEKIYLGDQRGPRLLSCDHGIDPVYYRAWMRSQRQKEKSQEYKSRMGEGFRGKTLDQIGDWLRTDGEIPSSSSPETSASTPRKELAITLEETP